MAFKSEKSARVGKDQNSRREFLAAVGAGTVAVGVTAHTSPAQAPNTKPRIYPDQDQSEVRWGFLVDLRRCTGCNACAVTCKSEFDVRLGVFRNGVIEHESGTYPNPERRFVPWLCNHCAHPSCLVGCPVEPEKRTLTFPSGTKAEYWARATYQRPDGLVLVDQDRCVGCGTCVSLCPYQARYLDRGKEAGGDPTRPPADKCTMCFHRLEEGVVPACVNTCPAEARVIGNLNDPNSDINQRIQDAGANNVAAIHESWGTEPRVYYIGLDQQELDDAHDLGEEARREAGLQRDIN